MKYKALDTKYINDVKVMSKGDILEVSDDKSQILNITTGVDIKNIHVDELIGDLSNISDEWVVPSLEDSESQQRCYNKLQNACSTLDKKPLDDRHPFQVITDNMFKTYMKKNTDYGNSFDQSLDKWGLSVAAIRLGDKLNRFESYVKNRKFAVKDEGVRDTLSDLATYAIMTIMYLDGNA